LKLCEVPDRLRGYIHDNAAGIPHTIDRIILFGSYARGTACVQSDIDIALVAKETWQPKERAAARMLFDDFPCATETSLFFTTDKNLPTCDKRDANYWISREGVTLWHRN